jgi:SAM-dependent methyltransferase
MTFAHHTDHKIRFHQQYQNAKKYLIPFIAHTMQLNEHTTILDIGCGDGGVMCAFLEMGCKETGIELNENKFAFSKENLSHYLTTEQAHLIKNNIYEEQALTDLKNKFDLIILKDVIEHIPDQERFIPYLKKFLKPGGRVFFGFPPWYMPHGGHQQMCHNKILASLPYFHILPKPIYMGILKLFGEGKGVITELSEIKDTGISIERFEKIVKTHDYEIEKMTAYLINPIYEDKFGWKPREQLSIINHIPFLRNFITTCVYYIIRKN